MELEAVMAQFNPVKGDIEGNTRRIIDEIESAENQEADLIIFPEMAVTGYFIRDHMENNELVEANREAVNTIKQSTGDTAVVVGFIDREGEKLYNAAAVLQNGNIEGIYRKKLLPNYRYFDDKRYFEPGNENRPIAIESEEGEVKLGVSICEDMWSREHESSPVEELAENGADVIVNINASPFYKHKRKDRHEAIQRHVENTGLPFLYLNTVGATDTGSNIVVFDGDSLVYNSSGDLVEKLGQFEEETSTVEIDTQSREFTGSEIELERKEKEIYEALLLGVKDYCNKTGFKKVIEPISGGIDSSLGMAVCADALGAENVLAFNLPSEVNREVTKSIADRLAENFGVDYSKIPIESIYQEVLGNYETNYAEIESGTAKENVYARVRSLLMMLVSNDSEEPALLVSNGNGTELALSYVTLYGDMASGLNILGDLSKMEVYDVARYVNERHGEEMIPEETFEIQPSAELKEDQVDPFDYSTVSPLVEDLLEKRLDPSEIVRRYREKELDASRYSNEEGETVYENYSEEEFRKTVYDTYRRMNRSAFKRVQSPPIIAVSERSFGTDFRESIINKWDGGELD